MTLPAPASSPAADPAPPDLLYASGREPVPGGGWLALRLLRRKWFTLLAVVVLFGAAAELYVKRTPKLYRAVALIELSIRRPRIVTQQSAVIEDSTQGYEETLNTKITKLRGTDLLPHVLTAYRACRPDDTRTDEVLSRELSGRADFTLLRRTRLVRVTVQATDPRFAADACQAYAQAAERSARDENRSTSDAAVDWLQAQSDAQRRDVEAKDASILAFRQTNQLDALEGQRKGVDEGLMQINSALVDVESRLALETDLLETLRQAELTPDKVGSLPANMPHAAEVEAALDKWNRARTDREALLAVYTPEHPAAVSRTRIVEIERTQAAETLRRAWSTAEANVRLLTRQTASIRGILAAQRTLSGELEMKIVERTLRLEALQRARDASDNAYRGLLARIQEARLAADENTTTVKMVSPAMVPGNAVAPRKGVILALALLLGLAAGALLAYVIDSLEDYIAGPEDVEQATGLPVLAVLPHVKAKSRLDVARATLAGKPPTLVEAFAGLRNVLDSTPYKSRSRVILLLSSLPAEGKTVAACNLATAFARSGQRTLLIDFDLRRSRLVCLFPPPERLPPLAEALAPDSRVCFETRVYDGGLPNLSVMAGQPGSFRTPADLMTSPRVAELLTWARTRYDRIVLDAPPAGIVSDGFVLAGLADMVLLVTRVDVSRRQAVAHTLRRLHDLGVSRLGAVVGDLTFTRRYYGLAPDAYYQKGYTTPEPATPPAEA